MTPVGRNQPCPCGSGKRYKECHGALADAAPAREPGAGSSRVPQLLREALNAQQSGRVFEAAEKYRRVLAVDPASFDASHMLSLLEYEIGHYDEALSLIRQAIELRPELGPPRQNLRLLESLPLIEKEICREVLPRLAARVDGRFAPARLAAAGLLHVVVGEPPGDDLRAALARILAARGVAAVRIWGQGTIDAPAAASPPARLGVDGHPRGGLLVLLGTARSPAAWLEEAHPEAVLLVATRDDPCAIIDRVDDLEAAGCARPGLWCASPVLAQRLRLPLLATLPPGEAVARGAP